MFPVTIHSFEQPIPVITTLGNGYILYVKSSGIFENDEFCIVLKETGELRHFITTQIKIEPNYTYGINVKGQE